MSQEIMKGVHRAISGVIDPEIGISIMELNLVDRLDIGNDGSVDLEFHATTPYCPPVFALKISQDLRDGLLKVNGVKGVKVTVTGHYLSDAINRQVNARSLLISDMDDTIFATDSSVEAASRDILGKEMERGEVRKLPKDVKSKIYFLAFDKYSSLLVPNMPVVEFIKRRQSEGARVVVLSARGSDLLSRAKESLESVGLGGLEVMLRDDLSSKDEEWKRDTIAGLVEGFTDVTLLEDKEENLRVIEPAVAGKNAVAFVVAKDGSLSPFKFNGNPPAA